VLIYWTDEPRFPNSTRDENLVFLGFQGLLRFTLNPINRPQTLSKRCDWF
jgi:hypothetical protein